MRVGIADIELPKVRGKYHHSFPMKNRTFFRVGGKAEVLFCPQDVQDLQGFLRDLPDGIPVHFLGAGSNLLVRDGGIDGVVISLPFRKIDVVGTSLTVGAGAFDVAVASAAARHGVSGMEFLCAIPGSIGGAVAMNAGCYGGSVSDVFVSATALLRDGTLLQIDSEEMGFSYRCCKAKEMCIVEVVLKGVSGESDSIRAKMLKIKASKELAQPTGAILSCGSVFKNPEGAKAYELIKRAGCEHMRIGGAHVSKKHCNFILNDGSATALDIESLILEIENRVMRSTGIALEHEVCIIGRDGS